MQRTYVRADLNLDKFLTKKFFDISQGSGLSYKATFASPMRPEDRARQVTFPFPIRPEDKSQDNKFEIATTPETLKAFFESAEGKEFKQALKDNANKLIVWANKNLIDPRYIEKFINTYLNYSANDDKKNAEYFAIYSTGVPLLESIVKIIESNTIPLVLRKEAISRLAYKIKTHEPRALIFDTYEALELNEFFANVEGEQFKKALKDNVDKLIAWTKKNDIDSTPFSKFKNIYANYSATNVRQNIEYFALFSIGVPLLEGIVKLLESDTIPLSLCQAPIAKLASDLMKCAPGTYTIISDAYVALIAVSNLSVKWMDLRRHIAEEFALKYLRKNYTKDQVKEIVEIHYINAIINHVAKALSTNTIEDPNIQYCNQAIIEDSIYHFVHHREGISSELTTGNILGNILNSILETLHETLEELNSIGDAESIIFEINTEINKFNSKYFSDELESTHDKETIKADLNAIISQFEKRLKESKAGERILKKLNSFTGEEKIPTFVNNQGAIISRFEAELDRYGKDKNFYDPNEIFVSEDYVTYEIGQKAEYILFLSLFERLRNSEYLNPENLAKYELPELKATINYFPGHSLKLAYINLEKVKVGEKNHQSFIPYFIEAFLDSNNGKKQNELIKFITLQMDEIYKLEIVDEIGKYLKSAAHLSSTRKETEQNNLIKVISQIIVPKDKKLIHILNALPLNAARLFFNKLPKSNLSILAKNDPATFFIYADIDIVKANLHIFPDKKDANDNTPLLFAIRAKRADIVKLLLEQGAKVNTINKDGYTPLCIAARDSDPLVVTTLLNAGALMNYRLSIDKIVKTPLHIAIEAGRTENVRILLDELLKTNASVITNDEHGNSPLLIAIKKGNVEMAKLLLTYDKIAVDAIDKDGKTALELAAEKGLADIVKLLLSTNRINPNRQTNPLKKTALMLAIENNHLDTVKAFLENTPKVDINLADKIGSTPLHWAVRSNRVEIFQLLLNKGASLDVINTLGHTPFSFAVYINNSEIIKLLLKWGVDPNTSYQGRTLLIYAAINNHFEAIRALLESEKTNLNAATHDGSTALHAATQLGHGRIIELLLAKGANPNLVNNIGQTPLHRAAICGNREAAVEALLKSSDIDPNYMDNTGYTPLSYALQNNSLKTIKALIAHPKTDIKAIKFPLHWAIQNDFADIIPSLIDKKADPNATDENGDTPLILAIKKGNVEACGALLESSEINPNNFDSHDFTPLHYAIKNTKIAELLLAHPNTDPNIHFTGGHTPLNFAISNDNLELAQALLNNEKIDPVTPINGLTPLTIALHKLRNKPNAITIINALLANKKYHDAIYKEAITHLFQAVQSEGDVDIFTMLVKAGIPLDIKNEKGETLFSVAVANGNVSALTFMLKEKNADALREEAVSLLFRAVEEDNAMQVKALFAAGISFSTQINDQTPLQVAIASGKIKVIKAIHEIQPLETNHLLLNAIENGNIKTAAIMLKAGISLDFVNRGDRALPIAVRKGNVEMVQLLLEYGANPDSKRDLVSIPLRSAVELGHVDIVKVFLENNTYRDAMKKHATFLILVAAQLGQTKQIQTLLKAGLSPDVTDNEGHTILWTLLYKMQINTLKTLLNDETYQAVFNKQARDIFFSTNDINIFNALQKAGVAFEKDENGKTRFEIAIEKKQMAIISALLDDETKRDDYIQYLFRAIERGDTKSVRFILLEVPYKIDISAILLHAIQSNQIEVAKVILEVASTEVKKLFFQALENGQIETLRMLLEAGMSPVMRNEEGNTPLHLAVLGNFPAVIDLLLTYDRHPDLKNNKDSTPLLWATQNGNLGIVKLLLENKADPNLANQNGQVPLLHAADVGNFEIVKLLLEHGANPTIKDSAGNTPAMLAHQNNHRTITQIIEVYAATDLLNEYANTPRYKAINELINMAISAPTHKFTQAFSYFKEIDALAQQTLGPTIIHENKEKNKDLKARMADTIEIAYRTFKQDKLDESIANFREDVKRVYEKAKSTSGFMRLFNSAVPSREVNKIPSQKQNMKG